MPSLISQSSVGFSALNSENTAKIHLIITLNPLLGKQVHNTLSTAGYSFSRSLYKQGDNSGTVLHTHKHKQAWLIHSSSHILFIWQHRDKSSHFSITSRQYQLVEKSTERAAFIKARSDFSGEQLSEKHIHLRKWRLLWGHSPDGSTQKLEDKKENTHGHQSGWNCGWDVIPLSPAELPDSRLLAEQCSLRAANL